MTSSLRLAVACWAVLFVVGSGRGQPVDRLSHRPVGNGLDEVLRPEEALARRLMMPRELQRLQTGRDGEALQGEFRELVQRLMQDRKFLDSIRGSLSPEEVERLRGRFERGEPFGEDSALQRMLEKTLAGSPASSGDLQALRRLAEQLGERGLLKLPRPEGFPVSPSPPGVPPSNDPPRNSGTPPAEPPGAPTDLLPPMDERSSAWWKDQLDRMVRDLDSWIDSPSGKSWANYLKDMALRYEKTRVVSPAVSEQARRLSGYLPRLRDYLPRTSITPPAPPPLPRLPSFGPLSAPGLPSGRSAAGAGQVVLFLAVVGLAGLLLWWGGGWLKQVRQAARLAWRLGPWPVSPGAVTSRADLVRAFEYLALLRLGPAARTQHHLDLARQIGAQPDLDPQRRRDAAGLLADLYEVARYTPDEEPLPDQQMDRARRELCYLAGVKAA